LFDILPTNHCSKIYQKNSRERILYSDTKLFNKNWWYVEDNSIYDVKCSITKTKKYPCY
jgi:hypothetical protein